MCFVLHKLCTGTTVRLILRFCPTLCEVCVFCIVFTADLTCITSGPPTPTPSTALAALVVIPVLLLIFAVLAVVGVACLWRKPSKVEEDKSMSSVYTLNNMLCARKC